jgi:hypothetical protein
MRQYFTRTCTMSPMPTALGWALPAFVPVARRQSAVNALAERYVDDQSALDAGWLSQVIFATRAGRLSRWSGEALQAVDPDA